MFMLTSFLNKIALNHNFQKFNDNIIILLYLHLSSNKMWLQIKKIFLFILD